MGPGKNLSQSKVLIVGDGKEPVPLEFKHGGAAFGRSDGERGARTMNLTR